MPLAAAVVVGLSTTQSRAAEAEAEQVPRTSQGQADQVQPVREATAETLERGTTVPAVVEPVLSAQTAPAPQPVTEVPECHPQFPAPR